MPDSDYQLGHEADELERLNVQGRALAAPTRALVEAAGLRAGMRVLDLGSGAGDMSFVVADVVGPGGEVVGIERAPAAVAQATARAHRRGLANVRFVVGDIHDPLEPGPFDARVGRLVLMYVPDPAAVLRRQAAALRPGGIVAPIEFDVGTARTIPETAPREPGAELGAGGIRARRDPAGARSAPQTLLPLIERAGVATAAEVDPDTLERRLGDELSAAQAVFAHPALTCAWAVVER